jgi:hypothetical protein
METGIIPDRKLLIFICYAHEDCAMVDILYKQLVALGYSPWMDHKDIAAGQDWDTMIEMTIGKADAIIICLSKSFVSRPGYMHRELVHSLKRAEDFRPQDCFLLSLKLNECEEPYELRKLQYIELYNSTGYKDLIKALNLRAEALGLNHTNISESYSRLSPDVISSMLTVKTDITESLARAACKLVRDGKLEPDVLSNLSNHTYFLIRRLAIEAIIESNSPNTLDLLYLFKNTSYHISQGLIRDYLAEHLDEMDHEDINKAYEILEGLNCASHVSDISKTKNTKLLEMMVARISK